jgi:diamine N-acetyltransferase
MVLLSNENIKLRAVEPEDLEWLYRWENDTRLWQVGNTITPYSRYQIKNFVATAEQDIYEAKQLRLMIDTLDEDNPQTIGCIDLYDFDPFHQRAAIGIMVSSQNRSKGVATQALALMIEYALGFLKLHQLYCYIPASNQLSIRLFEKAGFVCAGKLADWVRIADGYEDVLMYQLKK